MAPLIWFVVALLLGICRNRVGNEIPPGTITILIEKIVKLIWKVEYG